MPGVKLYLHRVIFMDGCEELMPDWPAIKLYLRRVFIINACDELLRKGLTSCLRRAHEEGPDSKLYRHRVVTKLYTHRVVMMDVCEELMPIGLTSSSTCAASSICTFATSSVVFRVVVAFAELVPGSPRAAERCSKL